VTGYLARRENTAFDPSTGTFRPNGKRSIVFDKSQGFEDRKMSVPCGMCKGCLLARATGWAVKATHESGLHLDNSFVTLTYSEDFLPSPPFVQVEAVQKFLKRLRRKFGPVRYLTCGEYGSKTHRPHYHLLLFGYRPDDGVLLRTTQYGNVFLSQSLQDLWSDPKTKKPFGLCEFGSVTPASAGYVARYTTKKIFERGEQGEEFLIASKCPPLGVPWLEKFYHQIYPGDAVRFAGKTYRPPATYDAWLEKNHPQLWKDVRLKRIAKATEPETLKDNDSFRLPAKEKAMIDRVRALKRETL
jgi:hypothetical protein